MRLSLAAMDFADALFISDSAEDTGGARHVAITPLAGRAAYSRFVMKDLLQHIETEHVLLIQWDGYVVNPTVWSNDFLAHDYIGARWGFHQDDHSVGNGGFSLRSRQLLTALADPEVTRLEPEDEVICRQYRPMLEVRHGIRFAPTEVADRFSFETTTPRRPTFGFHGLFNMWMFLADDEIPAFILAMPHSVVESIQYFSLARNFAESKRVDAARMLLKHRLQLFPGDAQSASMLEKLTPVARVASPPVSRNAFCPCGSGKRYKHCCGGSSSTEPSHPGTGPSLQQAVEWHRAGRLSEARQAYLAVLDSNPDPLVEHYLGVIEMQEGRPQEAESRIRAALSKCNDQPDIHNNLGLALRAQGRLEEAVETYRTALELDREYAPAWSNLGLDLHKLGQLDSALDALNRALTLDAGLVQARFTRALLLLTLGDYSQGWREYESRMLCPEYAPAYRLPGVLASVTRWRGERLDGKSLLLIGEQGIGDTLQFARYARSLSEQGARISLYVSQPHVVTLLEGIEGISSVHTGDSLPSGHDFYCHLLSLPVLCGTKTLSDVPAQVPYLHLPEGQRTQWRARLDTLPDSLKVGLAWAGNPANVDDRNRSCTLAQLTALLDLDKVTWVNLQLGTARTQIAAMGAAIVDWGDEQTDYASTGALIAELDLVVSVDTSIAHAAGAMGVPVYVMLQHQPDFRWLRDCQDSPWYPCARLFRQRTPGDWAAVAESVRVALSERLADA